jgi:ubiquinone/menaquinone biosynthesis C-methylase UbiE
MNKSETKGTTLPQGSAEAKPFPCIVTKDQLSYREFSIQPEYVAANRELINNFVTKLPENFVHVDIATGTGLIPQLIIEEATKQNKSGKIIGIDPNITSLNIAKENVWGTDKIKIEFIEGMGQDLKRLLDGKIPPEGVDGAGILDALHEIKNDEDKIAVIKSMVDILKPEGLLVFNSAFTTQGIAKDPMGWGKWKIKAMEMFGRKRDKQIKAMPIHTPEEYKQMIENAGLQVDPNCEIMKTVTLTLTSLEAISKYPAFSVGALEDMPGQELISEVDKCNAMIAAVRSLDIKALPRVWYEIIAKKPATIKSSGTIFGK